MKSALLLLEFRSIKLGLASLLVLISIIAGWRADNSYIRYLEVFLLSVSALICWGLFVLCDYLWFLSIARYMEPLKNRFLLWLFALSLFVNYAYCAWAKNDYRVQQARSFVALASQRLDAEKMKRHPYPQQLPVELERLKPEIVGYSSDGKNCDFTYQAPLSMGDVYRLESDHTWRKITSL